MTGPCMTYKGKLILPRYCTGAQQKILFRRTPSRHEHQTIMMAPMVGQKRCFSEKLAGMNESSQPYPGVTLAATSGKERRKSDNRNADQYRILADRLGRWD